MRRPANQDARFDRVDRHVRQHYIETGRLAGANWAIQFKGDLYSSSLGFLDREGTRPMGEDSIFRIFSMTKPITAVAAMMLVEEGAIDLQDAVSRFIPSWSGLKTRASAAAAGRQMRIIDLFTHCSGLTYGIQYRTDIDAAYRKSLSMRRDGQSLETLVSELSRLPLEFEPGTAWNYSVSTDVLGFVIEKVSGATLREFFQQRIFHPLGMTDTDFHVPADKLPRLAGCYVHRPDELLGMPAASFENDPTAQPTFLSGGGGLFGTVRDYLAFCRAILNQGRAGGTPLLSPATWQQMSRNHLPGGGDLPSVAQGLFCGSSYTGIGFGLGWATTIDPANAPLRGSPGDTFWSGMANTFFWCDPAKELIGIFMTQILPSETYPLQREVRALIYDAICDRARPLLADVNQR